MKQREDRLHQLYRKLGMNRIDRYLISRFLGTFAFMLTLLMVIIVVIDVQEKISTFLEPDITLKEIVLDYYFFMIPYYAVLLSPLFIFITVIYFTTKLTARSEIIAINAAGMSFGRMLKPYMFSAAVLSLLTFFISSTVLPYLSQGAQEFDRKYLSSTKFVMEDNIQLGVSPGVYAYFGSFDSRDYSGRDFSLEKFDGKTLVSRLTANQVEYDTLNVNTWRIKDYQIRTFDGLYEHTEYGTSLDTVLPLRPSDILLQENRPTNLTTVELYNYINRQRERGVGSIQSFEIEYHTRFASLMAAFILTLIGVSLSSRKVKGGMGLNIATGLALTFAYILLFTITKTYAEKGELSPFVASWLPNLLYLPIALFLYRRASK